MSWRPLTLALAGLALAACESPTTPPPLAQRAVTAPAFSLGQGSGFNVRLPATASFLNPCNGETVNLTGYEHVMVTKTDTTADLHINVANVTGTGATTGTVYHFSYTENRAQVVSTDGTWSLTMNVNEVMVAKGKAPNFMVHLTEALSFDGTNVSVKLHGDPYGVCH